MSDQFYWHLSKDRSKRLVGMKKNRLDILIKLFPPELVTPTAETVCGIRLENRRLMTPEDYTGPLPMRFPVFNVERTQHDIVWTVSVSCQLFLYLSGLLTFKAWKRIHF